MTSSIIPEFNAQSRFLFVEAPLQQLPHNCASCRRYDRANPELEGHLQFLDFNVEIEFFGKIFLCRDCLREVNNQLGWADEIQVKRAQAHIRDLLEQVRMLSEENENLRNAVGNLSSVASRPVSFGTSLMVPMEDGDETIGGERSDEPDTNNDGAESSGTDEGSAKSDDEQGSPDLRGDVDVDQLLADL